MRVLLTLIFTSLISLNAFSASLNSHNSLSGSALMCSPHSSASSVVAKKVCMDYGKILKAVAKDMMVNFTPDAGTSTYNYLHLLKFPVFSPFTPIQITDSHVSETCRMSFSTYYYNSIEMGAILSLTDADGRPIERRAERNDCLKQIIPLAEKLFKDIDPANGTLVCEEVLIKRSSCKRKRINSFSGSKYKSYRRKNRR